MLKAYKVWCGDDDHGQVIEFAERAKDVSRHANDRCGCKWIDVHVTRDPDFDKYAPGPVTIRQYLDEGWYWECSGCSRHVYKDDTPVIIRGHVYHAGECVRADLEHFERWHKRGERLHISMKQHIAAIRRWLRTHSTIFAVAAK